jgi:hypothetical protein
MVNSVSDCDETEFLYFCLQPLRPGALTVLADTPVEHSFRTNP